jgi:predicted metal-dependent HD superfamily phosphohydrolase
MTPRSEPSAERWHATWRGLGVAPPAGVYDALCARYGEPHRAYHTLQHLAECFDWYDGARQLAERPFEVELALWFHDAIYEPRASDSEERSAAWAADALRSAGAAADVAARVSELILATKHARAESSRDQALLLDVDLSILGAPPERFREYEVQVRREYAFVPDEAFRKARAAILARFAARPRLYATDHFATRLEAQARSNLRESIERLAASREESR